MDERPDDVLEDEFPGRAAEINRDLGVGVVYGCDRQALGDVSGRYAADSRGCVERRPKFVDGKLDGVARTERGVEEQRLAIRLGVEDDAEYENFE